MAPSYAPEVYGLLPCVWVHGKHVHVPGPDGKLGYGGTCFPKDVNAFIIFAKKNGINLNSVEGGWKTNLTVRPEKDWENLLGRAIVDKES